MSITNRLRSASMILGVLLLVSAPTMSQETDKAVRQVAAPDATQVSCRNVNVPGSHMKYRVCATLAEWSDARSRALLLRNTPAAGVGPTGDPGQSTAGASYSFQR